jgi:transcriptional regulator with XRE-family HTH domain
MKLNVEIPGIGHFEETGTARRMAKKAGISPAVLSGLRNGTRGLSIPDAKTLAPMFKTQPVGLYVESQHAVLKSRIEAGDGAAALRGLASVMDQLKALPEEELAAEGKDLRKALTALAALVAEALADDKDEPAEEPTKKPVAAKKSRDAFGKAVQQETGKVERDAYGKRLK